MRTLTHINKPIQIFQHDENIILKNKLILGAKMECEKREREKNLPRPMAAQQRTVTTDNVTFKLVIE